MVDETDWPPKFVYASTSGARIDVGDYIGNGAYAEVYKGCLCSRAREQVAIKFITDSENATEQFNAEFDMCSRARCAAAAYGGSARSATRAARRARLALNQKIVDYGMRVRKNDEGALEQVPFIVMPLYECCLHDYIRGAGAMAPDAVAHISYQLLSALEILHSADIIHGDVKPENIMVRRACDGCCVRIVLCDFGSACASASESQSRSYDESRSCSRSIGCCSSCESRSISYPGTATYFAPEILVNECMTIASDVWSAMLTIFFAATGAALIDVYGEAKHVLNAPRADESMRALYSRFIIADDEKYDAYSYILAHLAFMYAYLGPPSKAMCASEYYCAHYFHGAPRYCANIIPHSVAYAYELHTGCASSGDHHAAQSMCDMITRGLEYDYTSRPTASALLQH